MNLEYTQRYSKAPKSSSKSSQSTPEHPRAPGVVYQPQENSQHPQEPGGKRPFS
ncbi:hypothetical protein BDZ94DRAFT_1264351 [Collybia nuda]|uniref:Uncharacterized protein n=1 Tax=Collybia nuda TaxID=64659 RepID=A0A9P5Y0X3_9AGAR|nr:hypothetical protein BDZ94DRAFT_1264351 [Collybia nuda]